MRALDEWLVLAALLCCLWVLRAAATPLGLPPLPASSSDGLGPDAARLGKRLFFDSNLSVDGKISCAKCHSPALEFTDGLSQAVGQNGRRGTRNAPSLLNVAYAASLFWDGRASDLETQALAPLLNPVEHALGSESVILETIGRDAGYRAEFARVFHPGTGRIDAAQVGIALAAYERTLLSGGSAFDRYFYGHVRSAMSGAAVRGLELFRHRARCASCHLIGKTSSLLSDGDYHVSPSGLPEAASKHLPLLAKIVLDAAGTNDRSVLERLIATDSEVAALGRFVVTREPSDIGKFKTPSLRNVASTGPYMHDGSVGSLEEAVDLELYGRSAGERIPIVLTSRERLDLIEFLRALTGTPQRGGGRRERGGSQHARETYAR